MVSKRWTSCAKSLRAQFGGTTTWWNLTTSRLYQQSSVEFGGKDAQCWAREIYAQTKRDTSRRRSRNPMTVLAVTRKSANKWWRTSFCSRFRSVRDSAITRCNASGSIASYALLQMENRRNSTIGQKLEVNYLYNGQLRTSCRTKTVICSSSSLSSTSRSTEQ